MEPGAILVVEDDPDDRLFIGEALERAGFPGRALFAEDGAAALERVKGRPPALVLLDLMLPKLGGLDVLSRLRQDGHGMPVVIFTSSRLPADVKRAYALGANSYVSKPVEPEAFAAALKAVATYWLEVNLSAAQAEEL